MSEAMERKRQVAAARRVRDERRGAPAGHAWSVLRAAIVVVNALLAVAFAAVAAAGETAAAPRFGLGSAADDARMAAWDIAIDAAGASLPAGQGSARDGASIYAAKCAHCHGASGREGPDPPLVGGAGSLDGDAPMQTVGSYWPYATTIYDYVHRAMPFTAPGSLAPDEVYALTAFLLHANGIIAADTVLDRDSLPAVRMPNRGGFVPDPRPDVP
ncbi:MAG: cytochrome c [Gammaproteobacteria bacterium]